jgi:hypothetical protein
MTRSPFVPSGVQVFYHSAYGVHVQTIPTLPYDAAADTFDTWAGSIVDSDTMINDLVATFLPLYPASVVFDAYRIYTQANEDSLPFLEKIANFTDIVGTESSPGWSKATQGTISALGEDGSKCRLVLLDFGTNNDFDALFTLTGGILPAIMAEWGNDAKGWSSRGDSKPTTFLEFSKTLNEKLRREYRMF